MEALFYAVYFLTLVPPDNAGELNVEEFATGYVGQEVILPCQLQTSQQDLTVIQVTWSRKTGGKKTLALYDPIYGINYLERPESGRLHFKNPSRRDATLVMRDLRITDAGDYCCQFTTFPNGSISGDVTLEVLAIPLHKRREHILSTAVYVMLLLLLLTMISIFAKLKWKTRIQGVKSNSSQLEIVQDDRQIEYALLNLHASKTGERQTRKVPKEEVPSSEATVYAIVNH